MSLLTGRCSEKYGKKLIGKTDMDDALKRLDKLTQEEARMATAEVLRATHAIDERVASVDDKVTEVLNGAQTVSSQTREFFNLDRSDGKESNQVIKQTANDVDQVKRSSSLNLIGSNLAPYTSFQKTSCGRTSTNGSPHQIRRLIITLRAVLITRRWQPGSFKAAFSGNGNQQARFFGFMGNVRTVPLLTRLPSDDIFIAGSGKSILWLVDV
jgi:hypothetical protein